MRHLENHKPANHSTLEGMSGNAMSIEQQRKVIGGTDSGSTTGTISNSSDIEIE